MIRLGILDQSGIVTGMTAEQAMRRTIELAEAADKLGYSRYWVSEHHDTEGLAGSSPEVLMAAIAAQTSRMRVGSAGVLLQNYSPYKIAENFRVLEALYPGRIDLGIGRSAGGAPAAADALRDGRPPEEERFREKLLDLAGFLGDRLEAGHRYAGVRATPIAAHVPEFWLLGSGSQSAELASELGAAFSYAHFIKGGDGSDVIRRYYERYKPGPLGAQPRANACAIVICADTDEEARRLAAPVELRVLLIAKGQFGRTYMTPEEAEAYPYADEDLKQLETIRERMIVGGPERVKERLERFCGEYGIDELIVLTMVHDFAARLRSYELLARSFGLA